MKREKKKKGLFRELFSWVLYLLVFLILAVIVVNFVGQKTVVSGSAMSTSLNDGDQLIIDKLTYRFTNPKRFDVVIFPFQYKTDTMYIRRVIGLPGETIQITEGTVYINGNALEDPYGMMGVTSGGLASEPITLGEDEYFVLGDNRSGSADSREPSVGNIRKDSILGKVWFRIWPMSELGFV